MRVFKEGKPEKWGRLARLPCVFIFTAICVKNACPLYIVNHVSKPKKRAKVGLLDRRGKAGTSHPPPGGPAEPVFDVTLASGTLRRDEK